MAPVKHRQISASIPPASPLGGNAQALLVVRNNGYNEGDHQQLAQSAFDTSASGTLLRPSFISGRLPPK
ncbi:uncharacterized protein N7500_003163 [Penicillium coprophilum]|uniref:uncharacterized protein n=1 Tax=Penicillium coprophilum TaxID=36646 RepID=UPI0023997207|nr:uncharacterized protein N7500_003163 [Penicillium coprophilum]KAJ5170380.1 hypothetical protein N7500_003163 [Penicillium coprophilum]